MTQDEFGACGGVTRLTQSKYEKGESSPDMDYLMAIETRGVDFDFLLSGGKRSFREDAHNEYASLVGAVMRALEIAVFQRGIVLSPDQKISLIVKIFRHSRPNGEVNKNLVNDFIDAALE